MPIDFHDERNANTYASRRADDSWITQIRALFDTSTIGRVADIGCGGGIYSRAWRDLGASSVIGIDSSAQMIADSQAATPDAAVAFRVADAIDTGLDTASVDTVFSRAVVHHLNNHPAAMAEAFRVLTPGGMLIVQDRTIEDVQQPVSPQHFRARIFSSLPRLLAAERRRRPGTEMFRTLLRNVGFRQPTVQTFWETRRTYNHPEELRDDLLARTGRSILHELSDAELESLTTQILQASDGHYPLKERDRWTMWIAQKPSGTG